MAGKTFLAALLLLVVRTQAANQNAGWLVKTGDYQVLADCAVSFGYKITPLVSYPEPSRRALARFGSWYVLGTESDSQCSAGMLRALTGVESVESNRINFIELAEPSPYVSPAAPDTFPCPYLPNDPLFGDQWDKRITQTDWAWNAARGGGVVIAIIDSGADTDHEDLAANLIDGYNFVDSSADIEDLHGHGTHVSGIAAALMDNAKGIAGTAPDASIMPLKVSADGTYTDADLAEAIIYATDRGASVVNMSLRSYFPSTAVKDAVKYAWEAGVVLCAAAGNEGKDTTAYPAGFEHVISVGASTSGDSRWSSSNYGPSVDVFAPGAGSEGVLSTTRSGAYGWNSGTSMAAPQVAGLAALILSQHPEYTNQDVTDRIVQTADTLPISGDLRINARAALGIVDIEEEEAQKPVVRTVKIQGSILRFHASSTTASSYALELFDVTGRKVFDAQGRTDGSGTIELRPTLSSGVYFWSFRTSMGVRAGKIVYVR